MLATTAPPAVEIPPLPLETTSELRFQIRGGEHHGRILRIASLKCSIGSAAGCTLRLRGQGIQPLHCLIICGRNGTVVRRSSPHTYLNGGAFTDALLKSGDILRIANVELVVVACPTNTLPAPLAPSSSVISELNAARSQTQDVTAQLVQSRQQLAELSQAAEARCADLATTAQSQRAQLEATILQQENLLLEQQMLLAQERTAATTRQESLSGQVAQLTEAMETLQKTKQRESQTSRQHEIDELRAASSLQQEELERLARELETRQAELTAAHLRAGEDVSKFTQALKQVQEELQNLQSQRCQEQKDWTSVRARFENDQAELTAQLHQRQQEVEGLRTVQEAQSQSSGMALKQVQLELSSASQQHELVQQTWQKERSGLVAELDQLKSELEQRHRAVELSRQEAEARVGQMTVTMEQIHREMQTVGLSAAEQESAWQQERDELNRQIELLETQRRAADQQRTKFEDQVAGLAKALSTKEEALAQSQQTLDEREVQYAAWKQQVTQQIEENQHASGENLEWQQKSRAAEEQVEFWRAEAQRGEQRIAELLVRNEEYEASRLESDKHNQELAESLARQNAAIEERESACSHSESLAAEFRRELEQLRGIVEASQAELDEARARLDAAHDSNSQNNNQIQEALAAAEATRLELAEREKALVEQRDLFELQRAEFVAREQELNAARETLAGHEAALEASYREKQTQLEEQAARIEAQVAQHETERAELAQQQARLAEQMAALEDRVRNITSPLGASRRTWSPFVLPSAAELEALSEETSAQPEGQGVTPGTGESTEPPVAPGAVDSPLQRLASAGNWNEGSPSQTLVLIPTPEEPAEVAPPKYEPTSFLAQAAEMAHQEDLLQAVNQDAAAPSQQPGFSFPEPRRGSSPVGIVAQQESEDDSIDEYMARLLERMRGGESPSPTPVQAPPPVAPVTVPIASDQPVVMEPVEPGEFTPRSQAPEQSAGLSAMRNLANSAARSAIHTHKQRHVQQQAKKRSLIAAISFLGSLSLGIAAYLFDSTLAWPFCGGFGLLFAYMISRACLNAVTHMRLPAPSEAQEADAATDDQNAGDGALSTTDTASQTGASFDIAAALLQPRKPSVTTVESTPEKNVEA